MTEDGTRLTDKTLTVLRQMLEHPELERAAGAIGKAIGMAPLATATQLARLISVGYVADRRGDGTRLYRLRMDRLDDARSAAGVRSALPRQTQTGRRAVVPTNRDDEGAEVWTLGELRAAVARGEESPAFLALVEQNINNRRGTRTR